LQEDGLQHGGDLVISIVASLEEGVDLIDEDDAGSNLPGQSEDCHRQFFRFSEPIIF
jgi:hypothetical protein